jgi:hypothetical protein
MIPPLVLGKRVSPSAPFSLCICSLFLLASLFISTLFGDVRFRRNLR